MASTFSDELGTKVYVATVLKHGLLLYNQTKMKPNTHWTPARMMAKAKEITGKPLKPRGYRQAADALDEWLQINAPIAVAKGEIK